MVVVVAGGWGEEENMKEKTGESRSGAGNASCASKRETMRDNEMAI